MNCQGSSTFSFFIFQHIQNSSQNTLNLWLKNVILKIFVGNKNQVFFNLSLSARPKIDEIINWEKLYDFYVDQKQKNVDIYVLFTLAFAQEQK